MTNIGDYAFSDCIKLSSITIPNSVTHIGESALRECTGLTLINYSGAMKQWEAIIKGYNWDLNTGNYKIRCTDGDIT